MKMQRHDLPFRPAGLAALLLLAMAAGCDGVLGIEGLTIGCVEGQKRCAADNAPEVCNAFGVWEKEDACVDTTCVEGTCTGQCMSGRRDCDEKTPKLCNEAGLWDFEAACEYACFDGKCDCEPGQTRCIGNTFGICGDNRAWQDEVCNEQTCITTDPTKPSAECVGVCAPGKRCLGSTPQTCDATGQWQGDVPCGADEQCKAGACVVACTPKSKRCFENRKQTCDESGHWQDDVDALCVGSTCDPDTVACVGVCAPEEIRCKDAKTPQSCGVEGQWQDGSTCDIACVSGTCTICVPGELLCEGNTPRTCGSDGQWEVGAACVEQTCVMGACQGECAPGTRCLGNTPQTCNAAGQWQGGTPCEPGEECKAGSCSCIPDDLRCFDNTPQLCNASKEWEDLGAACTGQTCDPDVAACVGVCEPAQKQCQDANTVQHCDAKGAWQTAATCALGCMEGECVSCAIGQSRCTGNTPQTCGTNGQWQDESTCVGQTCVGGSCMGECVFGSGHCAGKWPLSCDALGVWRLSGQPCAQSESCSQGECAASCTPGAKRCAGDYPQTCDSNGTWQSDGAPCGTCIECNPDTGMCEPDPTPLAICTEPMAIAAGFWHTCALFPSGKVKCWGVNQFGQLGLGDTNDRGDEPGEMGQNLPFVDLGLPMGVTVAEISAGGWHTCARTSDGGVKCWGYNSSGQLGLGDTNDRGDSPGEMGQNLPFVDLGLPMGVTVAEISAGGNHTCARTSDGRVKCWGNNTHGQLGLGDTNRRGYGPGEMGQNLPFVDLGLAPGVMVAEISVGYSHTCARTSDGGVKCWGYNGSGHLGLGDTNRRGDGPGEMGQNLPFVDLGLAPGVTVAELSAGYARTCARTSDGAVKCWGYNAYGQLGLGDTSARGDELGEMGQNLPFVDLGLPAEVTVAEISAGAGGNHTCARLSDGGVKCWGVNQFGRLGLGDTNDRGNDPLEMGTNLPFVNLGLGATATTIGTGGECTCVILTGGSVKCWGSNTKGQLGLFDTLDRGDDPNEMGDSLPPLDL